MRRPLSKPDPVNHGRCLRCGMLGIVFEFGANGDNARQRLGSVVNDRQRWSELVFVGELLQCTRDRGFVGLMHRTNMFEPFDETPTHDRRTFPHLRGCSCISIPRISVRA